MLGTVSECGYEHQEESFQLYSQADPHQNFDLYDMLLHEPATLKKPSVLYDYSPPQGTLLSSEEPSP
jgi:hypothetical protein